MREQLAQMKQMTVIGDNLSLNSAMKATQQEDLEILADLLVADMKYTV